MILSTQEVRLVVRVRGILLDRGVGPEAEPIRSLTALRDAYIRHSGVRTYLSQMLGSLSSASATEIRMIESTDAEETILELLARRKVVSWPYKLTRRGQSRYL